MSTADAQKTFVLELTLPEIQAAAAAIGKLPWEIADPLIQKVRQQVQAQLPQPVPEPVPEARPRRSAQPAEEIEEEIEDVEETAPQPRTRRAVQDEPDPLPGRRQPRRPNGVDRSVPPPDLAAEELGEPTRGRI